MIIEKVTGERFDQYQKNHMNGEAIEEDEDTRSAGKFSNNYIWEENLGDASS